MKNIVVLGSTGSIGRQALEVVVAHPEEFKIIALGCNSATDLLIEQVKTFHPQAVAIANEQVGAKVKRKIEGYGVKVFLGSEALSTVAVSEDADTVLVSIMGSAGIAPTIKAIRAKKNIALATKEVMVSAGDLINEEVKKNNVKLIPVDSEHSAIFQCLHQSKNKEVNKIYLTCSGGPFRGKKRKDLERVTIDHALKHPNWQMGAKITIDCATLMNKGLELIEAQKLFNLEVKQIQILIHPQSIIHSMVEFIDGSILAQLGPKDMRFPIRYGLSYPARLKNHFEFLDPFTVPKLEFEQPDWETFEGLGLAIKAALAGGTMPVVLNAADEVAVNLFLKGKIKFLQIPELVSYALNRHELIKKPTLDQIMAADSWTRKIVGESVV